MFASQGAMAVPQNHPLRLHARQSTPPFRQKPHEGDVQVEYWFIYWFMTRRYFTAIHNSYSIHIDISFILFRSEVCPSHSVILGSKFVDLKFDLAISEDFGRLRWIVESSFLTFIDYLYLNKPVISDKSLSILRHCIWLEMHACLMKTYLWLRHVLLSFIRHSTTQLCRLFDLQIDGELPLPQRLGVKFIPTVYLSTSLNSITARIWRPSVTSSPISLKFYNLCIALKGVVIVTPLVISRETAYFPSPGNPCHIRVVAFTLI